MKLKVFSITNPSLELIEGSVLSNDRGDNVVLVAPNRNYKGLLEVRDVAGKSTYEVIAGDWGAKVIEM